MDKSSHDGTRVPDPGQRQREHRCRRREYSQPTIRRHQVVSVLQGGGTVDADGFGTLRKGD